MTEQEAMDILLQVPLYRYECDIEVHRRSDLFNALSMAIKALEEVQQYRAIGTPEECRAAVEKQKERKPIKYDKMALWDYACPKCGEPLIKTNYEYKYCDMCGQKLDWGDVE